MARPRAAGRPTVRGRRWARREGPPTTSFQCPAVPLLPPEARVAESPATRPRCHLDGRAVAKRRGPLRSPPAGQLCPHASRRGRQVSFAERVPQQLGFHTGGDQPGQRWRPPRRRRRPLRRQHPPRSPSCHCSRQRQFGMELIASRRLASRAARRQAFDRYTATRLRRTRPRSSAPSTTSIIPPGVAPPPAPPAAWRWTAARRHGCE